MIAAPRPWQISPRHRTHPAGSAHRQHPGTAARRPQTAPHTGNNKYPGSNGWKAADGRGSRAPHGAHGWPSIKPGASAALRPRAMMLRPDGPLVPLPIGLLELVTVRITYDSSKREKALRIVVRLAAGAGVFRGGSAANHRSQRRRNAECRSSGGIVRRNRG